MAVPRDAPVASKVKNISFLKVLMGSLSSTHFHSHGTCGISEALRLWILF